jgi:hypothetical protein
MKFFLLYLKLSKNKWLETQKYIIDLYKKIIDKKNLLKYNKDLALVEMLKKYFLIISI